MSKKPNEPKSGQFKQASQFLAGHVATLEAKIDKATECVVSSIDVTFERGEFNYALSLEGLTADQLEKVCKAVADALVAPIPF